MRQEPLKTQEHYPGEAYFITFVNILQETIYKAMMWSTLLNVWCSSVQYSMGAGGGQALQLRSLRFNSGGVGDVKWRGKKKKGWGCSDSSECVMLVEDLVSLLGWRQRKWGLQAGR